jgi:trigger factor
VKVSTERIENSQVVLNIEVEPEEVESSLELAYRRLVKNTAIPGFRKGKAPRALLERFVGKEALLDDALEHLVPEVYNQAIEEQGIEVIAQPQIEVTQTDPVIFKATVAIRPSIELGDYRQIRLAPEPVVVAEGEVAAAMEQLRYQQAPWVPAERPVQFGDLVTIDVEGSVDGEMVVNEKGTEYHVLQDLPVPVPGFAGELSGMEREQEKEFALSFPAEHQVKDLAGREYRFKVKVSEIKEKRLPELDDEFAKATGRGYDSLDSLREQVATDLKARAEARARKELEAKAVEAAVEQAQVEFPPILVEEEIDRMLSEQAGQFRQGRQGMEEYLRNIGKTSDELREESRPEATRLVTHSLVLGKLAEEEKVEVSPAEVDADVEAMVRGAGERGEELRRLFASPTARQSIERALLTRKTVQRLIEITSTPEGAGEEAVSISEEAASEESGTDTLPEQ